MTLDTKIRIIEKDSRTGKFLRKAGRKLKNIGGDVKLFLDTVIDPVAMFVGGNALYLWAADKGLDWVYSNLDNGSGVATGGAYTVAVALGAAINVFPKIKGKYYSLIPLAKQRVEHNFKKAISMIKQIRKDPYNRETQKKARRIGWVKTVGIIAALCALYYPGDFPTTVDKWNWSLGKISDSSKRGIKTFFSGFAREGYPIKTPAQKQLQEPSKVIKKPSKQKVSKAKIQTRGPYPVPNYLQGRKITSFYSSYTGIYGIASHEFNPDFVNQLQKMWDAKIQWMKKKGHYKNYRKVVEEARANAIREYSSLKKPTRMTLDDYLKEAKKSIKFVNGNINWKKLKSLYGLKSHQIDLVKKIALTINEKDLIAYSLTELMPSAIDGKQNRLVLEMILMTAGREYLEFIPAMRDKWTSFGPYQWTSHSVYSVGKDIKGASLVNQALPQEKRTPDSVIRLRGNDHHEAAYKFAINNIAVLVRELGRNRKWLDNLDKNYNRKEAIIQYIATAHHLPSSAINAAKFWLDHNCRYDFEVSCSPAIKGYAQKTKTNFKVMYGDVPYDTTPKPLPQITTVQKQPTPNYRTHDVRRGENLWEISKKYGITINNLRKFNKIRGDTIYKGQRLKIPNKKK